MLQGYENGDAFSETYHDFNNENILLNIFGGFALPKKPKSHFLLCLAYYVCVFLLYMYLLVLSVITMHARTDDKVIWVQTFYIFDYLLVGLYAISTKRFTNKYLNSSSDSLKDGVYQYKYENHDEEHDNIKKKRVSQLRFIVSFTYKLFLINALSNVTLLPLIQFLFKNEGTADESHSPYLPLPIIMPFNTRTLYGFVTAYTAEVVFLFSMNVTLACTIEVYVSCALQLIAQVEILNHSLRNIEKRAYLRLIGNNFTHSSEDGLENLYNDKEFKMFMNSCLRENVRHHQAIFR